MTMTMTTATLPSPNNDIIHPRPALPACNHQPSLATPTTATPNENAPETRLILKITANKESVNIALLHRRCFELMLHSDPNLKISTINSSKPIISNLEEFPANDEYLTSFKSPIAATTKSNSPLPFYPRSPSLKLNAKTPT